MSDVPVLSAENVCAGYPGVPVLAGVDVSLHAGCVLGIVGPNGAGKTTLLRAVTGIVPLQRGKIRIWGKDLSQWSRPALARTLAVVPQSGPLIFDFSVREVVAMGRMPHQSPWAGESTGDRLAVDHALETAEMLALQHRSYLDLSGGEQRRALFARALAQEPRILLLDEPTSHLDPGQGTGLMETARNMARHDRMAVMVILHDLNMAALYCDLLVVLKDGKVWEHGTPGEVLTPEILRSVYEVPVAVIEHPGTGGPQVLINPSASAGNG